MISILLRDVQLTVRINQVQGEAFITNVGVPQGDCLSPVLFTFYLAKALRGEIPDDHNYCRKDAFERENLIPPELL